MVASQRFIFITISSVLTWTTVHSELSPASQTIPQSKTKVYNGDRAKPVPFMALLQVRAPRSQSFRPFCGATRITTYQLLTAAHCFEGLNSTYKFRAVLGTTAANATGGTTVPFPYSNVTRHPQFNITTFSNDYAVISLPRDIRNSSKLQTVKLAGGKVTKIPVGVVGWGLYNCRNTSTYLRYALGQSLGSLECKYYLAKYSLPIFSPSLLCAQFNNTNGTMAATDFGDSGGPLVAAKDNQLVQVALVSGGSQKTTGNNMTCTDPSVPQIFSKVSAGQSFILSVAPTAEFTTI